MIGIVDCGMGNLLSVKNAFDSLGATVLLCKTPEQLYEVEKIVLPGVGAFDDYMKKIREQKFDRCLLARK